jgi:hypothetical protein
LALGACEVADLPGIKHADGDASLKGAAQQRAFAASGGLADEMSGRQLSLQEFKEAGNGRFGVGDAGGQARQRAVEVDVVLGDVGAEVDGKGIHG